MAKLIDNKVFSLLLLLYSPLDQFENTVVDNALTVYTILVTACVVALLNSVEYRVYKPRPLQQLIELLWSTGSSIVRQQLQIQYFTPLLVYTMLSIAVLNLTGLIPYWFTVTGQLSVTLFLALSFFVGFVYWGFIYHGRRFLMVFVPKGAPAVLLPLIVLIEVVSYLTRPLSLSLRLFANMMAGHALIHILLGFVYMIQTPLVLPFGVLCVYSVMLLELGIAFIQAYVFLVLLCIYLNDSIHPGH